MIEEERKKISLSILPDVRAKIKKFKTSGHFIDQKLQNNYELDKRNLSLFEFVESQNVRDKIENITGGIINHTTAIKGIHLTVVEDKLLNCILKLLHQKSDNTMLGNMPPEFFRYGNTDTPHPKLSFSAAELFNEYRDHKSSSGISHNEIDFIKNTLFNLEQRKFLITYKRKRWEKRGKEKIELIDKIEEYQSLVKIIYYHEGLLSNEEESGFNNPNKGKIIVLLNPIFIDQIDTKFIEYPEDINKRTEMAVGGVRKMTVSVLKLRDYLIRAIAYAKSGERKFTKVIIDFDRLAYTLNLQKYIKEGRKGRLGTRMLSDCKSMFKLGLITSHKLIKNTAANKSTFHFELNIEFPDIHCVNASAIDILEGSKFE